MGIERILVRIYFRKRRGDNGFYSKERRNNGFAKSGTNWVTGINAPVVPASWSRRCLLEKWHHISRVISPLGMDFWSSSRTLIIITPAALLSSYSGNLANRYSKDYPSSIFASPRYRLIFIKFFPRLCNLTLVNFAAFTHFEQKEKDGKEGEIPL